MLVSHVWPGNFPENTHVCVYRQKGAQGTQESEDGFGWVQGGASSHKKCKTSQKERFMAEHDIIVASIWGGDVWQ